MEVSLNLLNKYVKIDDQDPKELADKITSIGLEVEGMHSLANGNNMTIGYVKECIDHPDSDHLHVCQVEVRPGEVTQIVVEHQMWLLDKKLLWLILDVI